MALRIWHDQERGDDANDGLAAERPVKSIERAYEIFRQSGDSPKVALAVAIPPEKTAPRTLEERVMEAIYSAIDDSGGLAEFGKVASGHRGVRGSSLVYVDGTFDLRKVARAAITAGAGTAET